MGGTEGDIVVVDIDSSPLTLSDVMIMFEECRNDPAYSGYDIFIDGDRHAVIARPKVQRCPEG